MKKKNLLYLAIVATSMFLFSSCEEEKKDEPTTPVAINQHYENDSIDVNDDGINDFVIISNTLATDNYPSTEQENFRAIDPLNNNSLLLDLSKGGYLFLNENDTIDTATNIPHISYWTSYSGNLISIATRDGVLDEAWKVSSLKSNDYFLAYQLNNVNPTLIGWILFDFDLYTGAYTIIDKKWTANSTLIIKK